MLPALAVLAAGGAAVYYFMKGKAPTLQPGAQNKSKVITNLRDQPRRSANLTSPVAAGEVVIALGQAIPGEDGSGPYIAVQRMGTGAQGYMFVSELGDV